MGKDDRAVIAIAGHSNTGKTTLLRTLTKRPFGEILDKANTTKEADPESFESMYAVLMDCPGFQNAGVKLLVDQLPEEAKQKYKYSEQSILFDTRASEAIRKVDVVLYVASLAVVPDESHRPEIQLIYDCCPNIIGVLNQYYKAVDAYGKAAIDGRVEQWKEMLSAPLVKDVLILDAHWDKPSRLTHVYRSIQRLLPASKEATFAQKVNAFADRQQKMYTKAFAMVAELILHARSIEVSANTDEFHFDKNQARQALRQKIADQANEMLADFIEKLRKLFVLAAQNPNVPEASLDILERESQSGAERVKNIVSHTGAGGSLGALIGAALGAAVGFFVVGVGTVPGAVLGAQLGGGGGGTLGTIIGTFRETNKKITGGPSSEYLHYLAKAAIALCWGVSFQGFGKSDAVDRDKIKELFSSFELAEKIVSPPDWLHASKREIEDWSQKMYAVLLEGES